MEVISNQLGKKRWKSDMAPYLGTKPSELLERFLIRSHPMFIPPPSSTLQVPLSMSGVMTPCVDMKGSPQDFS